MTIYTFMYLDRSGKVTAMDEFDASDDGAALKVAAGREWSGSYEIREGSRSVCAHVGSRLVAGR
jgi:hypothetical protein